MKYLWGFILGIILSCFIFVFILQRSHIYIEKKYDIRWCCMLDEAVEKEIGKLASEIFYVTFKILDYPFKKFNIIKTLDNEIKFK